MCGILGGINTSFDDQSLMALSHRGPDQQAMVTESVPCYGTLTVGQSRLNVVDRLNIDLPIRIDGYTILLNGEIYNHLELRAELHSLGWTFKTKTDTETALAAYIHWGPQCLERFNGMFALAIWDGTRFFCARDRLGMKPFFYRCQKKTFEFASEIKAFKNVEFIGQDVFDLFEFCFDEHTLYRNIFSLKPGECLTYDLSDGTCHTRSYWNIKHHVDRRMTDKNKAVNRFIELLEDSVRLRLRADVPVAMFLSGGLDSSLIAKLSHVDEVFTCQFDEFRQTINEERYVRDLAAELDINTHFIRPTRREFFRDLSSLSYHLEMPTGSFSTFPLYCLAKKAREVGYKVVLTGDGADELFAGYARNEFLLSEQTNYTEPKRQHYAAMLHRYQGSDLDRFCRMASRSGLSDAALMKMFLANIWSDRKSTLENICYVESRVFLQPLLQMLDRMTMAHGVEGRCPFLDHRLVEFAFSLDDSLRFGDGTGKWIVHEAAKKLLPKDSLVLQRTIKDGLATPVNTWLQGIHSFDRKHWNAVMTAECIKSLLTSTESKINEASAPRNDLVPTYAQPVNLTVPVNETWN